MTIQTERPVRPTSTGADAANNDALRRRRALWGSFLGTSLEWYDFFLYGSMAIIVFPSLFFSQESGFVSTMLSVGSFGVAFVVRPIGAMIFGAYGDRYGRRRVLVATMVLMGLATGLIGILPTDKTIGIWAPFLLVLLRILQGLSTGGEWGGALLMAVESAPADGSASSRRRGFYGAVVQSASPVGLILSNVMILGLTAVDSAWFMEWGWRIPFLFGGLIAIVGLVIRSKVEETTEFKNLADRGAVVKSPLRVVARQFPLRVLRVAAIYMGPGAAFYAALIFGQSFGVTAGGLSGSQMSALIVIFGAVSFVAALLAGHYIERIGAGRMMLAAMLALVVATPLIMVALGSGSFEFALFAYLVIAVCIAGWNAPMAILIADLFGADVRYTGVSLGYQIGTVLGGALPPIIALWLMDVTGSVWSVVAYLIFGIFISIASSVGFVMNNRRGAVTA